MPRAHVCVPPALSLSPSLSLHAHLDVRQQLRPPARALQMVELIVPVQAAPL